MRAVILAFALAACAPAASKTVVVTKTEACPKPPPPDECVAAWYAKADTPQCVDDWIDRLVEHRNNKRRGK